MLDEVDGTSGEEFLEGVASLLVCVVLPCVDDVDWTDCLKTSESLDFFLAGGGDDASSASCLERRSSSFRNY